LRDFRGRPWGGNKVLLTIFAGKIFLAGFQKKDSINHCDLASTIRALERQRQFVSRHIASLAASSSSRIGAGRAMADSDQEDGAKSEEAAAPKSKLKLIIIAGAVLLIVAGGGTWFFFFRGHADEQHAEAATAPKPPNFIEVPDMLVNLVGVPGERVQYLKVKLVLEVKEEKQIEVIKPTLPRVADIFQTYLRELRAGDLAGSAGLFRLREELTKRVNAAIAPNQVSAVLFKEIVVQ
jgi:flagellar FliL protein